MKNLKTLFFAAVAVFSLLFAGNVRASISVQDGSTTVTRYTTLTFNQTFTVTAGAKALVVTVTDHNGALNDLPTTLSWSGGGSLTRAVMEPNTSTPARNIGIYYLFNPTPAVNGTISGTVGTGNDSVWVQAYTLAGVDTTQSPLVNSNNNVGTTTLSITVASVPSGGFAAVSTFNNNAGWPLTITASSGTVTAGGDSADASTSMASGYVSGLNSGTATFTTTQGTSQKLAIAAAVFAPLAGLPSAPTGLVAVGQTNQVALTWNSVAIATNYTVLRSATSGSGYTSIGTTATTSYTDTGVTDGQYYYYVVNAVGTNGTSGNSLQASAYPVDGGTPPVAPAGLVATTTGTQVVLTWNATAGAASYNVFRSTTSGAETLLVSGVTSTGYTNTGLVSGSTFYYVVSCQGTSGISGNSSEVSANVFNNYINNFDGVSAAAAGYTNPPWGNLGTWTSTVGAGGSPGVDVANNLTPYTSTPYNLTQTNTYISEFVNFDSVSGGPTYMLGFGSGAGNSGGSTIFLEYLVNNNNLGYRNGGYGESGTFTTGLNLVTNHWYRFTIGYGPVNTGTGNASVSEIVDDWGVNGTNFVSNLYTTNVASIGTGLGSVATNVYPLIYFGGPNTPTYAAAMDNFEVLQGPLNPPAGVPSVTPEPNSLLVTWSNVLGADSYIVERATTSGGPYTAIATNTTTPFTNNATATTYLDTGATSGSTTYFYVVVAQNNYVGNSALSLQGNGQPLNGVAPLAPLGVAATGGTNQIVLTWNTDTGATNYTVYRSTTSGSGYTSIGTTATISYTDTTGLIGGRIYYYVLTASNAYGTSGNSSQVSASSVTGPGPANLTATGNTSDQVVLTWNNVSGATGYNVYRSTNSGGESFLATVSAPTTNYTDSSVVGGTTYYYVVDATNASGLTAKSSEASAVPLSGLPPSGLTVTANTSGNVALSWNSVGGAVSYNVLRSTTSGAESFLATVTAPTTNYTDSSGISGTMYYYEMVAVNSGGTSGSSGEVSATAINNYIINFDGASAAAAGYINPPWHNLGTWTSGAGAGGSPAIDFANDATPYLLTPYNLTTTNTFISTFVNFAQFGSGQYQPTMLGFSYPAGASGGGGQFLLVLNNNNTVGYRNGGYGISGTLTTGLNLVTNEWYRFTLELNPVNNSNGNVAYTVYVDDWGTSGTAFVSNLYTTNSTAGTGLNPNATAAYPLIYFSDLNNGAVPYAAAMDNFEVLQGPLSPPAGVPTVMPGSNSLQVAWNNVLGADSYIVERSATSGGPYTAIATNTTTPFANNSTATTYLDTGATNGYTNNYYVIIAQNNFVGNSAPSQEAILSYGSLGFSITNTGAIVGSNVVSTLTVPAATTASGSLTVTLTSSNTSVVASTTVTVPQGVTSTNVSFLIAGSGTTTVTASAPNVTPATVTITGANPTINLPPYAIASVGSSVVVNLTLTSPYPFSGPYTITLTSGNASVTTNQTVTLRAGNNNVSVAFSILASGTTTVTAASPGLNPATITVGDVTSLVGSGIYNQWVADDYSYGSGWVDRVSGVTAALDANPNGLVPPLSVPNLFNGHAGVERYPGQGAYAQGFSIPAINPPQANPPQSYTNYTVAVVFYPTGPGVGAGAYYGSSLIMGYDDGGAGQPDWGISWRSDDVIAAGVGQQAGDTGLYSSALLLNAPHAIALQTSNNVVRLFVDGALAQQVTGLNLLSPTNMNGGSTIPLLSTWDSNIGNAFTNAVAEVDIYTNGTINGAALTTYLLQTYQSQAAYFLSTNAIAALVGSNATATLSVSASVTANNPETVTITSGNTNVTASQTITLPVGVTTANLSFPIVGVGTSVVTISSPDVSSPVQLQVSGAVPSINLPVRLVSNAGSNALATLTLTCPYPFSGSYTISLTSDNPSVVASQTVTLPAGVVSTNLSFAVLAGGFANVTATGTGLNPAVMAVGTMPQMLNDGLVSQWVGDDYVSGNSWTDRVSSAVAALDGGTNLPISVPSVFGSHNGVQRNPVGGDTGFSIPANNAPTGDTNYTVVAVISANAPYQNFNLYYLGQTIIGFDVPGAGKSDWGISWGGNTTESQAFDVGIGYNGGDWNLQSSQTLALNTTHAVALQVSGNNTVSLYVDGVLAGQHTGLSMHAPTNSNGTGVIPLISTVGANDNGNVFTNLVAEVRIYNSAAVDGAALTAYLTNHYSARLLSANAYLTSLVLNPNVGFAPGFTTNGYLYYATNSYGQTPTVTVTNADSTATNTLIVNGVSLGLLTNSVASVPLTLGVGSTNVVAVQVVSQDLSVTNLYVVDVTMQGPPLGTNAFLASLAVHPPAGTLPGFATNVYSYSVTNAYVNNPVTVTASSVDTNAMMTYMFNGAPAGSLTNGLASTNQTLALNPPTNTVAVWVVSQDLSQTNIYTVNLLLQPSQTVPKLTNGVSGSTLTLTWPADHLGYRLLVQTNNLNKGVSSNTNDWGTVAGSQSITSTNIAIIKAGVTNMYYRLVYP